MDTDAASLDDAEVPVVGIGASAGGIEALEPLLGSLPEDPGYALVIIQHKSPDSDESLPKLFERMTNLPVETIENGMTIERNHVYLNPGHSYVDLRGSRFELTETDSDKPLYLPIDHFFESLADAREHNSTGIVLSGTGTDGTLGLKKIKYRGGITIIQDPETASYPDMPQSARETVNIDFELSPGEITETLENIKDHPYVKSPELPEGDRGFPSELVENILGLVYDETGHDMTGYKHKPIGRRLRRQLAVQQLTYLEDLYRHLRDHPDEIPSLLRDLLIDYTRFFRDRETYEYLRTEVLPGFLPDHPADRPVRIWVPGCSTGEEVYSLAIVFKEVMNEINRHLTLKIFATDLDNRTLNLAREGFYPKKIAEDISDERLEKYFSPKNDGFQVKSSLREGVIFAEHNLLQDPPYSNIDFLSCRNLLIYLDEQHQNQALEILHYALNTDGLILLGPTETTENHKELFASVDGNHKLFRKKAHSDELARPILNMANTPQEQPTTLPEPDSPSPQIIHQAEQGLLHEHGPPAVLLEDTHDVVHFFGDTDPWLKHPEGEVNYNVVEMARDAVEHELIDLLNRVSGENQTSGTETITLRDDQSRTIELTAELLRQSASEPAYYLVIFKEITAGRESEKRPADDKKGSGDSDSTQDSQLRDELESTRSYLHRTIERLETKNKELRAKNRELQSLNEEYQSMHEELETSKEELQSTNEELMTVNEKLEEKVQSLDELNTTMNNLLRATEIPVIFLNRDLEIKWFTPAAREIFNLIDSDEGRPLSDITSNLVDADFEDSAREVLRTLVSETFTARSADDESHQVQIIPYRSEQDAIEGVVITFIDITEMHRAEKDVRTLAVVLKNSNDAIMVIDESGTIETWNRGAENLYGYSQDEAVGMNLRELVPEAKTEEMNDLIENLMEGESPQSFRTRKVTQSGDEIEVWVTASRVHDEDTDETKLAFTDRNLDWLPEGPETD